MEKYHSAPNLSLARFLSALLGLAFFAAVGCSSDGDKKEKEPEPVDLPVLEDPVDPPPAKISMPIEVLGGTSAMDERTFKILSEHVGINWHLELVCHRCSYRDNLTNDSRGAKASFQINQGDWIDITNAIALNIASPAKEFQGFDGGFQTVRASFELPELAEGEHTIRFRFNGTDGFTSGFRIIEFNLINQDQKLLDQSSFELEDPNSWLPPIDTAEAIAAGKDLWQNAVLQTSPLNSQALVAGCSDCHTKSGRDLAYFGFSNYSIQQRSLFHGLSELQAQQIASYIRSLEVKTPEKGRPWNPPYQPGVGLDDQEEYDWAAGAGWDAVVTDRSMLGFMFPQGYDTQAKVDAALKLKSTLNIRELPIPIQLPDWNSWLPDTHPLDYWGESFAESDGVTAFKAAMDSLATDREANIADRNVVSLVESLLKDTWNEYFAPMGGPQPCIQYVKKREADTLRYSRMDDITGNEPPYNTPFSCEDGLVSLNHWLSVKNWEIMHENQLEEITSELYPYGEKRGWFGRQRNVFEMAPHRSADNSNSFKHQTRGQGAYESNAWYQLQLILNAGHRDPYTWFPQDWFYTGNWLALNGERNGNVNVSTFFVSNHLKMLQNLDTTGPDSLGVDKGPGKAGWWVAFTTPWRLESRLYDKSGFPLSGLDEYDPALRVKVLNSLLKAWFDKTSSYPISELPRHDNPDERATSNKYEHIDYIVPTEIPDNANCFYSCPNHGYIARDFYRAMYQFRELGVDSTLRGEIIDWLKQVWPHPDNDWDALR